MPDNDVYPRCGSRSYEESVWARNWPHRSCELPKGHESDHEFTTYPGNVFWQWPYTLDELNPEQITTRRVRFLETIDYDG